MRAEPVADGTDVQCHECGEWFEKIGQHWSGGSTCSHPDISERKMELLTGLLMSDGTYDDAGKNPYIKIGMSNKPFLEWLDKELGWLSTDVREERDPEESARICREGLGRDTTAEDCSYLYRLTTRSHPQLKRLDWNDGMKDNGIHRKKVWPEDIELTPTVLTMYHCGDGSYVTDGSARRISAGMVNEEKNKEKVERYFERAGLPKPSSWSQGTEARWTVEGSRRVFEYMVSEEDVPPGFEYKFPSDLGGAGKEIY